MIIVFKEGAQDTQIKPVISLLEARGYGIHLSQGVERAIVGAIGALDEDKKQLKEQLTAYNAVEAVILVSKPYKLAGRPFKPEGSVITVGSAVIGGKEINVMAGPCTIESENQAVATAKEAKQAGAHIFRGGAYKPSTSPYGFQGLGEEGLRYLDTARKETGMPIITEVLDTRDVELVGKYTDIFQIGTRNMTNFQLLREVGLTKKPVMLKRGMSATIEEWLQAAEYILSGGNQDVILCERGIRSFEPLTRFTFDVNAIPLLKELSHLPVIGDPSHGTGKSNLVIAIAKAAIAAGADGLMIEVHPEPEKSVKDAAQALSFERFERLMAELKPVAEAVGRTL